VILQGQMSGVVDAAVSLFLVIRTQFVIVEAGELA